MSVGEMIRKRRQTVGLTLGELADQAGLTVGGLSQIERDVVNPTLPTLRRIAAALKAPVFSFLMDNGDEEQIVVRHGRRRVFVIPEGNASYESLSPQSLQRLEVARFSLDPGASTADEGVTHVGEEFLLVLTGSVTAHIGSQQYSLAEGDSIQFNSAIPHRYVGSGQGPTEVIVAMTPPWS